MKISFNYLFPNVTSCRCGGTITDAAVLMWGPVSITDTIAFSLIMKTSFIQMKFKSIAVAVNRLAPLRMQMVWHKALPTTQTASVTNNCPIFYGEKLAVMPCHLIHTLHWSGAHIYSRWSKSTLCQYCGLWCQCSLSWLYWQSHAVQWLCATSCPRL